ncbi:MAG: AAA family ATPase [Candidatus Omnitrophota bacterium]|jgi:chromosome segregation protein
MYFKRLEIVGFKSFCDKTTLNFEPGITAIVGPNGCGKSNIFDSIRWVLGEQSAKSLRGSDMQDVIFNGTDKKEPLSMAEVSLTFDNEGKHFDVDHNEVVITRRLFRSGESEYLLNKTVVRLKDILELLMGTGIGAENYSLIEQGKIDLILSSRPEDRRLIFDEAAGITKYKSQKKEAIRRLEETEQNLLRVNDIITEVKRQIGSLERQANKARRYKEIFEELKQKETNLAVLDRHEMLALKDNIANQISSFHADEERILALIQEQESRVSGHRVDLKGMEEALMQIKNQVMNLDNLILANEERIDFNKEKTREIQENQELLKGQIEQTERRIILDKEKLDNLKAEHEGINKNMEDKKALLMGEEERLNALGLSIKSSLDNIARTKRGIMELVTNLSHIKNELADLTNKQHIFMARKKRLEIEKVKVSEEKAQVKRSLDDLASELEGLESSFRDLGVRINNTKEEREKENLSLSHINFGIAELEKEKHSLESHREFLEKLKTKYEGINESMNAVVHLDKAPSNEVTGLVIKIHNIEPSGVKLTGEAKPIDLDTQKIMDKINKIEEELAALGDSKKSAEARIEEFSRAIDVLSEDSRNQEIALSNKRTSHDTILEQFNKITEEEEVIALESTEVEGELASLEERLAGMRSRLSALEKEQKDSEELIASEQGNIDLKNKEKEEVLVMIAQTKTELEGLARRIKSDEDTLRLFEDTYQQDNATLADLKSRMQDNDGKVNNLALDSKNMEAKIAQAHSDIDGLNRELKETEEKYKGISESVGDAIQKVESDRKGLDTLKNNLYELHMQAKDVDFKISGIKERLLQAYKVDIDTLTVEGEADKSILSEDIEKLKVKLDNCGTVNLVAIEEYDELKKRYDFLTQQQADLVTAKDSVHEAILKINRTTKKMFLETFEKVREEFRSYFKLLFNGGDAQIFLIDEQDPLESGIEIICRPPGKKLQNVLLLSGGEKSMSAIALIFAIFKVKPSPFCVLDEIDAALDEANVDRFGRMVQEFIRDSQFIVITHNKKTIANADVMYGITMQESGVSKIVSVKFSENRAVKDKEPVAALS